MTSATEGESSAAGDTGSFRLFAATIAVFLVFDAVASALDSDRGQWGLLIFGVVAASLIIIERLAFRESTLRDALGRPAPRGLMMAMIVSSAIVGALALIGIVAGTRVTTVPRWQWMLPGLFAQAGLAEEILFRGFLFERLRRRRTFRHAATLSLIPFVLAHLVLFARMPWQIAMAAVLLSIATTYPLAHLYELGGRTIWAPAVVHFTVQGALKVTTAAGENASVIPVAFMAASAILPYAAFLAGTARRQ